jgi:predicted nucleic acid-binding protein
MPIRVYADTSVYGGVFDAGIDEPSREFFQQVKLGQFELITSDPVIAELRDAPARVRRLFEELLPLAEIAAVSLEAIRLQNSYLKAGIVGPKSATDALHVAMATVRHCRVIVSWNFKHIVHFDKIPLYNELNLINGYDTLSINTPAEVIIYED